MISLSVQPELFARCLSSARCAVRVSGTSSELHEFINSKAFLNMPGETYKERYFELRKVCDVKKEVFPVEIGFGDAVVDEEGVEVFSFSEKVCHFKLNGDIKPLDIPINKPLNQQNYALKSPSAARSEKYLAVSGADAYVHIFKPDGKSFFIQSVGHVRQIVLRDNLLYSVEETHDFYHVKKIDVDDKQLLCQVTLGYIGSHPICFGREHLIYAFNSIACVHPLACLDTMIFDTTVISDPYYFFPMGNGFLQVLFRADCVCDIEKISIEEGVLKRVKIKEKLKISDGELKNVCFHENRLIMTFETEKETKMLVYDLVSEKLHAWPPSPLSDYETFEPRFLSRDDKIYYLFVGAVKERCNLTTYTFSKI